MPPDVGQPPVVPAQHHSHALVLLLSIAALVIAGVFVYFHWGIGGMSDNSVSLLVRDLDTGTRSMLAFDLDSGTIATDESGDPTATPTQVFPLSDETELAINSAGIVNRPPGSTTQWIVRVASAVPPPTGTPLAVWNDGARVAWVNPADQSLQIYERTPGEDTPDAGSYFPVTVVDDIRASSLLFSTDGATLFATVSSENITTLYAVVVDTEVVTQLGSIPGIAVLIQKP